MSEMQNDNLRIYEKVRAVPNTAKKTIGAGRLKGMTDINPMWRIKTLTEMFGPCGIGWKAEIQNCWIDTVDKEIVANVTIKLFIKENGEWSDGIFGIGGSKLSTMESKGQFVSDEAYKMAFTDAISVACKCLGIGADVYWEGGRTKYTAKEESAKAETVAKESKTYKEEVIALAHKLQIDLNDLKDMYNLSRETTEEQYKYVLEELKKAEGK